MATDSNVKVILSAEDKTGGAIKSATGGINTLNEKTSALAKTLGVGLVAAGAGAVAFLYSSAKAAGEAEAAMVRVDTTLKTMGESALKNKDAILEAAGAAVKLGFDDEQAAESITRFYQATGNLTEAVNLNNLAMDLAAAKSLDLGTATMLVNQVLSGNGRALKQYQIDIKETATPLEALGILQEKVAGQAEAASKTFEGQMRVLEQSATNLKETIGAALLEAITPFINQLTTWAANPDVQKKVKEIATQIGDFAKVVLPPAIETIKFLWSVFKALYDTLVNIEVQVFKVIDAISAMSRAIANSAIGKAVGGTISGAISEIKYLAGARAGGGPVLGGSSYLVGERGPEIFTPRMSGQIIPNGGGGITINITGNQLLSQDAGDFIADKIMRTLKSNLRL